jgi:RNA polymerase sigma-70 factor, ECF subfamily
MVDDEKTYTRRLSDAIDAAYEAYRAGEADSLERLVEAFSVQARNVIVHRLGSDDPTLEQQISHRAFMALKEFRGKSNLSTWFYRIAQNEANRELHRRIEFRDRHVPLDRGDGEDEGPEIQLEAKPANLDATLDLQKLRKSLPAEQDEVYRLMEQGFSLEEIAKQLGKPLGTIRSRYTLAKNKMKRLGKE